VKRRLWLAARDAQIEGLKAKQSLGAEELSRHGELLELDTDKIVKDLEDVFAKADPASMARREVPDWIIDNISFQIMHDPVVALNGQSYDKATLLEHIRRSHSDPLTREPLEESDLRPNLALKQACDQFLDENGWAVDW
jgi:STIP1 family protein 1